ncbi:CBS domain-containing protein [Desulfogranum mediterraneum]|uniref:CBS domain-containing protein n=1 Tax=Desulfogranum mediterraneum TaxID=160661 RepID=UPI000421CDC5|nr:CBS domain-containing protein [Desulfogranum mediterraneum]
MQLFAKDIMIKNYDTINVDAPAGEAIKRILHAKVRPTGHKPVSLMVVDEAHRLVGTVSMFYILYHLRPSFLNFGIDGDTLAWKGELDEFVRSVKEKSVRQIMNTTFPSVPSDEPLMPIVDKMIKDRIRRIAVVDNGKLVGVVYLSDIFFHLFND